MDKDATKIIDSTFFNVNIEKHGDFIKLDQAGGTCSCCHRNRARDTILVSPASALTIAAELERIARG